MIPVGRDLWEPLVHPPAQSRTVFNTGSGCSRLVQLSFEKLHTRRFAAPLGHPLTNLVVTLFLHNVQSEFPSKQFVSLATIFRCALLRRAWLCLSVATRQMEPQQNPPVATFPLN